MWISGNPGFAISFDLAVAFVPVELVGYHCNQLLPEGRTARVDQTLFEEHRLFDCVFR